MHVAVIIVGFRNPGDVLPCVAALGRSTHTDFEIVICENGGSEALAQLVEQLPKRLSGGQRVTAFTTGRNLGFAGGVNAGLARAPDADAWWILNPDTLPTPEALAAMAAKLSDESCEAVGCTLRLPDGTNQGYGGVWLAWLGRAVSIGRGTPWTHQVDPRLVERRQNFIIGASLLVGRRFVSTVGPMREDYFLYCEEIEWCVRAQAMGMRLGFASDAAVLHYGSTTTGSPSTSRLTVYLGERNKMLLTRDRYPLRLPVVAIAAAVTHTLRFGRRGAWRQVGQGLMGLLAGVMDQRGAPAWLTQ